MQTAKYYILNACCVCGADLDPTEIEKEQYENLVRQGFDPPVSHGYCEPCGLKMLEEFKKVEEQR